MKESVVVLAGAFFFGIFFGSFFWTLALRMSSEKYKGAVRALLTRPSHCQSCSAKLRPHHLIPVAGFFLSLGRCRSCGAAIPLSYPAAEFLSGVLCVCTVISAGLSVYSVCLFLLLSIALVISWIDLKTMLIPDALIIVFALLSVYPAYLSGDWLSAAMGAGILGAFFFLIILFFPGGFGGGDMKFAAAIGFFAGLELSIVVLEVALISGSIFGIIYALASRRGLRIRIPFGPFLTAGLFAAVFFGREILLVYYSVF